MAHYKQLFSAVKDKLLLAGGALWSYSFESNREPRVRKDPQQLRLLKHRHCWAACGLGAYCAVCRVICRSPAAFQQRVYMPCKRFEGPGGGRVQPTHRNMCSSGVHRCADCGTFSAVKMVNLPKPCYKAVGRPLTAEMKTQLVQLNKGIYPSNTSIYLGPPDRDDDQVVNTFSFFAQLLGDTPPEWARYATSMMLFRWQSNPEWLAFHLACFRQPLPTARLLVA